MYKNRGRETPESGVVSKLQRISIFFATKIIDCYSFVFITVGDKRLFDPSGQYRLTFTCVSESCRFSLMKHHDHHTFTFNGVYTSVKRNPSPFHEKRLSH